MAIHTLQKEKHHDFLKEERIDPITGDILQEGDDIVICASCKSAFLVDSWEYMDRKHCEQTHTLREIPKQEVVKIDKSSIYLNVDIEINAISNKKAAEKASLNLTLPFIALFYTFIYFTNHIDAVFIALSGVFMPLFSFFFRIVNDYKDSLHLRGKFLSFKKNKEWGDDILLSSIKNIRYYKSSQYWIPNLFKKTKNKLYTLEFTLNNNEKHKVLITKKELENIKIKTNLLQKFNKNSIPPLSINPKIEQNIV